MLQFTSLWLYLFWKTWYCSLPVLFALYLLPFTCWIKVASCLGWGMHLLAQPLHLQCVLPLWSSMGASQERGLQAWGNPLLFAEPGCLWEHWQHLFAKKRSLIFPWIRDCPEQPRRGHELWRERLSPASPWTQQPRARSGNKWAEENKHLVRENFSPLKPLSLLRFPWMA